MSRSSDMRSKSRVRSCQSNHKHNGRDSDGDGSLKARKSERHEHVSQSLLEHTRPAEKCGLQPRASGLARCDFEEQLAIALSVTVTSEHAIVAIDLDREAQTMHQPP